MSIATADIIAIVTETVSPVIKAPFELVDVEYGKLGGDYVLSILVDKPEGITVEDTADLTEVISPLLDTIKPDPFPDQYMLEISSPGLERPLKTKESLKNAVGSYVNISLYQAIDKIKVFEGNLVSFEGDEIILNYKDKTRTKTVTIPYQTVAKARLAVKI
ncbi:ribosome maturation factor RimP [Streptococcus sciuri]|uniref:Ribosome maturation factor RimP n=1 Tax=Streptococcus sciuri TaxID=2973939 RepID=A0ABT2F6T1_9STRE|nr:ribosome maturation factor RimP [Streptococcus sciuri]MCS4488183.1 ribosome maturation factor RimP [Streptococcus sciuri]